MLSKASERGQEFKLWSDSDYPANLSLWHARPPVLFYKGDLSNLSRRALALVGRVDPSPEGADAARRFARSCVDADITVVSGLAKGIDGASHRGALEDPPGYTYGVVGHGLDHVYPAENRDLFDQLPDHGAVISQFMPHVGAQKWTFPARNEAMCTLALGTVIIEGKPGCGSIIQADFSFKHGRPVFLLSRNLRYGETEWAQKLVKRGAHVIERFEQVTALVEEAYGELWNSGQDEPASLVDLDPAVFSSSTSIPVGEHAARAVLFDIDGVIADSRAATAEALASIASRHTGRRIESHTFDPTGSPSKVLQRLGVPNSYNVYRNEYDQAFIDASGSITLFNTVVDTIRTLKDSGYRLGAITAQPKRRAAALLPEAVRSLFDVFYTYGDTQGKKDVGIARALRVLKVNAQDAIYVGDQSTDLEAARMAGVKSIGVLWGFSSEAQLRQWPHDVLASVPADLDLGLVRSLIR
nr:HAD-IA family hydrolase [Aeromicrobium wangtongii]